MLTIRRPQTGRRACAMILNEPVRGVFGIVQCALKGCECHMVILQPGVDGETRGPTEQISWFIDEHECRALGKPKPNLNGPIRSPD